MPARRARRGALSEPDIFGIHRLADLLDLGGEILHALQLVGAAPVIGQPGCGQAVLVAHVRIEIDHLVGIGDVLDLQADREMAGEIFRVPVAIARAPTRNARWRHHVDRGTDGAALLAGRADRDLAATDEAEILVIEIVGIVVVDRMLLCIRAHEDIDLAVVEGDEDRRPDMGHDALAQQAA